MDTANHDDLGLESEERAFALAVAVIRDRMASMPKEDRNDLYELLPLVIGGDDEERQSACKAVREIFDQKSAKLKPLSLPISTPQSIESWVSYVAGRIREARDAAGLTQAELAMKSGLRQEQISRLEKGEHSPTAKTLKKIADATGKSVGFFDPSA